MLHSQIQESIPLLALGGLDEQAQVHLEQHLAVCPSCRALWSEYAFVAQELDIQVPPQELPPDLEAKLLQHLARGKKPARKAIDPPSLTRKPNFWRQPVQISRWALALGSLFLFLLVGAAAVLGSQIQQLNLQNAPVVSQPYTLDNLKLVELTASGAGGAPEGTIYLAPDNPTALLWLRNLDNLDWDHAYQLWLIRDGQRVSGGVFRPGRDGRAILLVHAPLPWKDYQEIGVTVEPKDGSMKPTTPRVIGGKLD